MFLGLCKNLTTIQPEILSVRKSSNGNTQKRFLYHYIPPKAEPIKDKQKKEATDATHKKGGAATHITLSQNTRFPPKKIS